MKGPQKTNYLMPSPRRWRVISVVMYAGMPVTLPTIENPVATHAQVMRHIAGSFGLTSEPLEYLRNESKIILEGDDGSQLFIAIHDDGPGLILVPPGGGA
jgi:hypothetical protein